MYCRNITYVFIVYRQHTKHLNQNLIRNKKETKTRYLDTKYNFMLYLILHCVQN